jgi:molybdopterin-containing oxidoreductase family iron-sulfur binding subunit
MRDAPFWRNLSELNASPGRAELLASADPAYRAWLARALSPSQPPQAAEPDGATRREFLHLLGAGLACAGVAACARSPGEKILPYTIAPPEVTPSLATYYATAFVLDGYAVGLLCESHEGRPTKVEGNPEHPASLGATSAWQQACVWSLYDPQRAHAFRRGNGPSSWEAIAAFLATPRRDRGAGLRILAEPQSSFALGRLLDRLRARYPEMRLCFDSPARPHVPGRALAQHDFAAADVVVALDADFVTSHPFALRYARQIADRRRVADRSMSRLYVAEPALTPTGMLADHRLRVRASEIAQIAHGLAGDSAQSVGGDWVRSAAADLSRHRGRSAVVVGERQPPAVHALAARLNRTLGNWGKTVWATEPVRLELTPHEQSLAELCDDMRRDRVDTLVVLHGDPSATAPADLEFARALERVPQSLHLSLYENTTSRDAKWFVPAAHGLESWDDARAYDGTASFVQPLIAPLFGGRTAAELVAALLGDPTPNAYRLVRALWRERTSGDFEDFWERALARGVIDGFAAPRTEVALDQAGAATPATAAGALEITFPADARVYDGRFSGIPWLRELPDPVTKLTWDNAVVLSPRTAARLSVHTGDLVALELWGRATQAPVYVQPGHADDTLALPLGYAPFANAYALRTSRALAFADGVVARRLDEHHELPLTQRQHDQYGRPLALATTLAAYLRDPDFTREHRGEVPSMFARDPALAQGEQWAMTIDLSVCTGCSGCMVACQAENNVLVVGRDGVLRGREMHWLRIDTYYQGDPEDPRVVNQPMLCQHCEKAPCEYVCPVNATVHSPDGLNEMIYNRCVGTRFCSNNCPYKVRRFNWFNWIAHEPANQGLVRLQRNPDVTVRERGVMEKCTYCVQRIRRAEISARVAGRALGDNEIMTACQQACPTRAITFGSLTRENAEVVERRAEPRRFAVLNELGTSPRTQYLARVDNLNPEILP